MPKYAGIMSVPVRQHQKMSILYNVSVILLECLAGKMGRRAMKKADRNLFKFQFDGVIFLGTLALPVDLVFYFAEYKITFNA